MLHRQEKVEREKIKQINNLVEKENMIYELTANEFIETNKTTMKLAQITKGAGGRIPRRRNLAYDQQDLEKQFSQF